MLGFNLGNWCFLLTGADCSSGFNRGNMCLLLLLLLDVLLVNVVAVASVKCCRVDPIRFVRDFTCAHAPVLLPDLAVSSVNRR